MTGFLFTYLKPIKQVFLCLQPPQKLLFCRCRSQLPMNTILLNTVLSACEKGGQWRLALHFFSTWSRLADGTSWARLAVACCAANRWQTALQWAGRMRQPEMYVAGMKACAGSLQWMAMLMWFEASRGDVVAEVGGVMTRAI